MWARQTTIPRQPSAASRLGGSVVRWTRATGTHRLGAPSKFRRIFRRAEVVPPYGRISGLRVGADVLIRPSIYPRIPPKDILQEDCIYEFP